MKHRGILEALVESEEAGEILWLPSPQAGLWNPEGPKDPT